MVLGRLAVLALVWCAASVPSGALFAPPLRYSSSCELTSNGDVEGFVTNESSEVYQLDGLIRFRLYADRRVSYPEIMIGAHAFLPAGTRVRIARLSAPFPPQQGDRCELDVSDAIRR